MHKISILILFIFLSPLSRAQTPFRATVHLGVAMSQVEGDNNAGYNKPGPIAGFTMNRMLKKHYGFETGIRYIQKGSRTATDKNDPAKPIYIYRYHYVEIPILFRYETGHFSASGGISPAYLIRATADFGASVQENTDVKNYDIPLSLNGEYQLGQKWDAGLGIQYSAITILRQRAANTPIYLRNGVYHNLLSFYLKYKL